MSGLKQPVLGILATALIIAIGLSKMIASPEGGDAARRTILDGFRRGRKAAWLPEQDWEAMLSMPVDEVRRRLSLGAPASYVEIRSAALKAALQDPRGPQ